MGFLNGLRHTGAFLEGRCARFCVCWAVFLVAAFTASPARSTSDCDKALHFFWKGKYSSVDAHALDYYEKAIRLCPGFIRPYELAGNLYRRKGETEKAIAYFSGAAELGSSNYKLYYLLASLLFDTGAPDEASRHLKKSLDIRKDYPPSLDLRRKIRQVMDREGPTIRLYEPATLPGMILVHQYGTITVRGRAADKSGVARVEVAGSKTSLEEDGHFLKNVSLRVGENRILVQAEDELGNVSTLVVVVRRQEPPAVQAKGGSLPGPGRIYDKSVAVVVGINAYEKWPVLEFALNDARAVEARFRKEGFDEVVTIVNGEATQRRILTELFHNLPQKVGRNDRVAFYFAGHGQTQELEGGRRKGYIIPADADPVEYAATAVSMDQIRSLSNRIPAKHILYVMDCCYSGLGLSRSFGTSPGVSEFLEKVGSMRAVQIVTAGGKGEQVQEKEGHGLFTTYFLLALEGAADYDRDGVVTGSELGAYLRPAVSNASGHAQTPLYGRLEGEGEFLFFVKDEDGR